MANNPTPLIEIWKENDEYVAACDSALVHAFGSTETEAKANLVDCLNEQRDRLLKQFPCLSKHLAHALEWLTSG